MLEILTFTGVDARTSFEELARIARRYPRVEFGILVGSSTDTREHGIFPSLRTVRASKHFARERAIQTALHLCGRYSREVLSHAGATSHVYALRNGCERCTHATLISV